MQCYCSFISLAHSSPIQSFIYPCNYSFIHFPFIYPSSIRGVNDRQCSFIHKFIHSSLPSYPPSFFHSSILSFIHCFIPSLLHSWIHPFLHSPIEISHNDVAKQYLIERVERLSHTPIQSFIYPCNYLFIHFPFIYPSSIRGVNDPQCSFIHKFIHSFLPSYPPSFILSFIHSLLHSFVASFMDSSIPFIDRKLTQRCGEAIFDWESWKVFTYTRKSLFTLRKLISLKDAWMDKWCEHK